MNDRVFFDTNILLYASASTDSKGEIVRSLLKASSGIISIQVLNKFVDVCRKRLKQGLREVETALNALLDLCPRPVPITFDTHILAMNIGRKYKYSIYDCVILAAATEASCSVLYSEDMQDGQQVGPVTIENPFTTAARM